MSHTAERMSRVDTAWLRMDNDVNLMMIVGVWLLATAPEHFWLKLVTFGRGAQNKKPGAAKVRDRGPLFSGIFNAPAIWKKSAQRWLV